MISLIINIQISKLYVYLPAPQPVLAPIVS